MLDQIPGFRPQDRSDTTTLVELTAKRWKAWMVIAFAFAVVGLLFIGWQLWSGIYLPLTEQGFPVKDVSVSLREAFFGPAGVVGLSAMIISLSITIYARFMAWWHHG